MNDSISIITLFSQADLMVKFIMILLTLASVWSWAIVFDKLWNFRGVKKQISSFENNFLAGKSLEKLYLETAGGDDPMSQVFNSAMSELKSEKNYANGHNNNTLKDRVLQSMQITAGRIVEGYEKNLSFLATVASSAPFIGLFGTVWGIMTSFQAIAVAQNVSLAVVAPGIAESLLATAFGLGVAIPAVIFYNKFASEARRFSNKLEVFSNELGVMISKEIDKS